MDTSACTSSNSPTIVWFRNDLRLHDHEPLIMALQGGAAVVLIYCVDPRHFAASHLGVHKTGPFRARFLLECLADLRSSCRALGGDLLVRVGEPERVLPELAATVGARFVYCHGDAAPEEAAVEHAVAQSLKVIGAGMRTFAGQTLVHADDLPFEVHALPDTFSQYRNRVERRVDIRASLPAPPSLPAFPVDAGELPTLRSLGLTEPTADAREMFRFYGGETAGRERLQCWMWDADALRTYKATRNGLLRTDDSSKLSPWLAHGCLSPRLVYAEVRRYERERVRNADTDWLVFELLWRDYFRLVLERWGSRLFAAGGLHGLPYPWRRLDDHGVRVDFDKWTSGQTGFPLVDAAMIELAATGYTSNRARQNVASFLTRVLGIDWRLGASWFESLLVDYDVASNWGNWAYVAGVGNDARGFRFFNVLKQARSYDPNGDFTAHWLSARDGETVPPMVDLFTAADASARTYERAVAKLPPAQGVTTRR